MKAYFLIPIFSLAFIFSCKHKSTLPEGAPTISYKDEVATIIDANCKSCHSEYSTYDGLSSLISVDQPTKSTLYNKITRVGPEQMPPDHSLSEVQIRLILAWIVQGAKNN